MSDMVVIVPTRERPHGAQRLVDAWEETGATCDLVFRIDDDDLYLDEYLNIDAEMVVGKNLPFGPKLNEQVAITAPSYRITGFMGDDHVPRTPGWDARIADALQTTGVAYGDDLLQGVRIPTAVFMTSDIPLTLGYFCAPGIVHMYIDNAWKDWGEHTGCLIYLPDVIIEHLHHANGKAEMDDLYRSCGSLMDSDRVNYMNYCAGQLEQDLEKIRGLKA